MVPSSIDPSRAKDSEQQLVLPLPQALWPVLWGKPRGGRTLFPGATDAAWCQVLQVPPGDPLPKAPFCGPSGPSPLRTTSSFPSGTQVCISIMRRGRTTQQYVTGVIITFQTPIMPSAADLSPFLSFNHPWASLTLTEQQHRPCDLSAWGHDL